MDNQELYSKNQRQLIKEFKETTQASVRQSVDFLTRNKWNLQNAINLFFDQGAMPEQQIIKSTLQVEKLFQELSSPGEKNPLARFMDQDKFSEFLNRYFKYADDNVVVGYILINIMEVETSGYIQFKNFVKLFSHLNISSPKDLQKYATKLEMELKSDKGAYKILYTKIYKFYLIGNKEHSLDFSLAEELWRIYLKPIMPLYSKFMEFLQLKSKKPTKVHKDLWNMVYEFAVSIKDPKEVSQSDAWPVFLDDFVQYCLTGNA